jgi:hypothetical protein
MTAAEMKEEFLILYDKITNFNAPGYEDEEISMFLSKAQERVFLHIVNPAGNKYQSGIELTEKRRKDLSELTSNADATVSASQVGSKADGQFFDLPADFLYAIQEEATISSTDACYNGNTGVEIKPITHNFYTKNRKNPHKKPYGELIWRMDFSSEGGVKRHELITDASTTVTTYNLRYYKRPVEIDITGAVDCELDAIIHRQIIDEAVAIATGVTNPEEYQIKLKEAQASE